MYNVNKIYFFEKLFSTVFVIQSNYKTDINICITYIHFKLSFHQINFYISLKKFMYVWLWIFNLIILFIFLSVLKLTCRFIECVAVWRFVIEYCVVDGLQRKGSSHWDFTVHTNVFIINCLVLRSDYHCCFLLFIPMASEDKTDQKAP